MRRSRAQQATELDAAREEARQASELRQAAESAEFKAQQERDHQERQRIVDDRAARILAKPASEHLARAAEIYATPVSSHEQTPHLLHVLVELGFAIAKGASG